MSTPSRVGSFPVLLTVKETAALLQVSSSTVRRMIRNRTLAFYRVSHSIRFDKAVVEKYLAAKVVEKTGW